MRSVFFRKLFLLLFCVATTLTWASETDSIVPRHNWLKIHYPADSLKRIFAQPISEIDSIFFDKNQEGLNINVQLFDNTSLFSLPVDSIQAMVLGTNIPTVFIDTERYVDEIPDKVNYLEAKFSYVPYDGKTDSVGNDVSIRGRGNSSWLFPKKSYRLKFDKKQSIAGLPKAKNFVLISNYIDNTLLRNAVAFKIAEMLEIPYSNKSVPVDLVLNGRHRGSYMLTNKVGINAGSVDIDEKEGVLWELDIYYDEEFKFTSPSSGIPCMLKDPDPHDLADSDEEIQEMWNGWKQDLEDAFVAIRAGNCQQVLDMDQCVKYFLLQDLVLNQEVAYPKSVYLYKESADSLYKFGPVWDFDWALGYANSPDEPLIQENRRMNKILAYIFDDDVFKDKFRERLMYFYENQLSSLLSFIDEYAEAIRDSAIYDAELWPLPHFNPQELRERNTSRFDENVELLKKFLIDRTELIVNHPDFALRPVSIENEAELP